MNFLSVNRMRAYRRGGRVRLVLKLEYPRLDEGLPFSEPFNSFYTTLADETLALFDNVKTDEKLLTPTMAYVTFLDLTEEYVGSHRRLSSMKDRYIVISRKMSFGSNSLESKDFIEVYDKMRRVFIK